MQLFAYNYTINVLSKCSNIISHRSSVFEGRHIDHPSSKVDTSIIDPRRSTHRSVIVDLRKSIHRSSKVDTSIFEDRRWKHRTDNPTSHRQPNITPTIRHRILSTMALHSYNLYPRFRMVRIILDGTQAHIRTYIIQLQPTRTIIMYYSYVLYAYLYCVYALVGGAISIRDPYICAVLRVCANGSHIVFHRPVV